MDRQLLPEELEALESSSSNILWQIIVNELAHHKQECIAGLRSSKNWEEHLVWEARISLIEELIQLPQTLIAQEKNLREEET